VSSGSRFIVGFVLVVALASLVTSSSPAGATGASVSKLTAFSTLFPFSSTFSPPPPPPPPPPTTPAVTTTVVVTSSTTAAGYSWYNTYDTCYYGSDCYNNGCNYYGCNANCGYYGCYNQYNQPPPAPCYPTTPGYPYCYPSNGYQLQTTTTAYSLLTETSFTTETTTSTPSPVFITGTVTSTATVADPTNETIFGSLMLVFVVLFLATLFMLLRSRTSQSNPSYNYPPASPAGMATSKSFCVNCGSKLVQGRRYCGACGSPQF